MIAAATLPLLLEHGDRVTTRQIAEAAGVAEGTIFRAFADKDELIRAVLEAALDPAPLDDALDALPATDDLDVELVGVIEVLQRRIIDIGRLVGNLGTRYHDLARRPMVDSAALTRRLERHAARLHEPPATAARLLRALTLSTTHPMLFGEALTPDEIARLFLHGVAATEVEPC
jgi:AcrR family transcriptional regulator